MGKQGAVYIVDDDMVVRRSLAITLGGAGYRCRSFAGGGELIDALDQLEPGCVVLDIHMPEMNGRTVQAVLADRRPDLPIIFMSGGGTLQMAVAAMRDGAIDFLEKPCGDRVIVERVAAAHRKVDQASSSDRERESAGRRVASLSDREADVMARLLGGKPNKIVAFDLCLSTRTVEMHRANIMRKFGTTSFAAAVQLALLGGLKPHDGPTVQ